MREAWYLGKVPEKRNRLWTENEKMRVFTMKTQEDYSAAEIARKFKASVIQIYNVVRLVKKGLKNECYMCGNSLTEKEIHNNKNRFIKACDECKEKSENYKKNLRKQAIKRGLCIYCVIQKGHTFIGRKALSGHKSCRRCISATHRRRYALGLCGHCGKNPIGKGKIALCNECAEASKTKTAIYRQRIKTT
jgi:transposase-like protein